MSLNNLIKDIKEILSETTSEIKQGLNKVATLANWQIGNRIIKEEQDGKQRAEYGKHLIDNISKKLTEQYGRGYSSNNLHRMRQFANVYKKTEIDHRLNWSKHRLLVSIKEKKQRQKIQNEAIRLNLSRDQIQHRLKQIKKDPTAEPEERYAQMYRPNGELYLCKTRAVKEGSKTEYYLDLGFKVWLSKEQAGLTRPKNNQIIQSNKTKQGYILKPYNGDKDRHYLYKARLDHVVDGDTIVANIELGFGIQIQQRFRFRNVNAPDLKQESGQAAREYLKRKLRNTKYLLIKTRGRDKFDRYVSDIFLWDGRTRPDKILKEDDYLNQIMLDRGHGIYAPGG